MLILLTKWFEGVQINKFIAYLKKFFNVIAGVIKLSFFNKVGSGCSVGSSKKLL